MRVGIETAAVVDADEVPVSDWAAVHKEGELLSELVCGTDGIVEDVYRMEGRCRSPGRCTPSEILI